MRSIRTSSLVVAAVAATMVFWAFPAHAPADSATSAPAPAVQALHPVAPTKAPAHLTAAAVPRASHPAAKATARRAAVHVTHPAPAVPTKVTPVVQARPVATPPATTPPPPPPPAAPGPDTCAAALAYLGAHSAPGFSFQCPGYAEGHQAMTCLNYPGVCPGQKLIVIAVVCPASYMNEASNSWVVTGQSHAPIDPYGYCH